HCFCSISKVSHGLTPDGARPWDTLTLPPILLPILPHLSAHGAPVLINQARGAVGRHDRALLPGADVAQMLAGEVERAVGGVEAPVLVLLPVPEARGNAEAERYLAPGDSDRLLQLLAVAGMQALDRRPRQLDLLVQRFRRELVRVVTEGIGA